jgi:hypothetical protein
MLASPSKASTKYGARDVSEMIERGAAWIERATADVKAANGRFVDENLAALAAAREQVKATAAVVVAPAASPVAQSERAVGYNRFGMVDPNGSRVYGANQDEE